MNTSDIKKNGESAQPIASVPAQPEQAQQSNVTPPTRGTGGQHDASIAKLARVSKWINKFPIPTDGATWAMCLIRDVQEALATDVKADASTPVPRVGGNTKPSCATCNDQGAVGHAPDDYFPCPDCTAPRMRAESGRGVGEAAREWISVKDRLPKDGQAILMSHTTHYTNAPPMQSVSAGAYHVWCWVSGGGHVYAPTHWQPYPEPPPIENDDE